MPALVSYPANLFGNTIQILPPMTNYTLMCTGRQILSPFHNRQRKGGCDTRKAIFMNLLAIKLHASNLSHTPSVPSYSEQWQQSLSHSPQWRPLPTQRLQQRAKLLLLLLAGQPAAAAGLRRTAAEQAQALPHHPAAVRQRHLARDRRARTHVGARPSGECLLLRTLLCRVQP